MLIMSGDVSLVLASERGLYICIGVSDWPRPVSRCRRQSNFEYRFKAMGEFKLELPSGNAQFGSKSAICLFRVTFQYDRWPWKTIGHPFYSTSSFVHHFKAMGEFKLELQCGNAQFGSKSEFFVPCHLNMWWMTYFFFEKKNTTNNRAPLLCCVKFCASFHSHQ